MVGVIGGREMSSVEVVILAKGAPVQVETFQNMRNWACWHDPDWIEEKIETAKATTKIKEDDVACIFDMLNWTWGLSGFRRKYE